jgi:hypothetical protein
MVKSKFILMEGPPKEEQRMMREIIASAIGLPARGTRKIGPVKAARA